MIAAIALAGALCASMVLRPANLGSSSGGGGGPRTYDLTENFEGTGYQQSGTWTESGTAPNEDYTGVVLSGSQSLRCQATAGSSFTKHAITASGSGEYWIRLQIEWIDNTSNQAAVRLRNGANSAQVTVSRKSDTTLNIRDDVGGGSAATTATTSLNTLYYVWIHYKKGSGSNAFGSVAFATTTTEPTSGTSYKEFINGSGTTDVTQIQLGSDTGGQTFDMIFDEVRGANDATVGSDT